MPSTAVVIGTGPGGSAAAWSLSRAGVDVTLIEAGPRYVPPRDYRLDAPDWELSRFPEKVSTQGRQSYAPLQPLEAKHSELRSWNRVEGRLLPGDQRHFMTYSHVVGVGGSTLHYAGESHRMHPGAMKMFSDYGVGADWPISYADLEPYYELAERLIGVAGPATDPQRPRRSPCPMAPHEMSYSTTVLGRGCKKLGLSWRPNPVAAASRAYDGRPPCNYCGQCGRGCPRLDKGTADLTLIPKALATGHCRLLTEMQALQIETDGRDRVRAVVCADGNGTRHRFKADAVVIACGAIETPRLLLNSSAASAPEGLANESGQVGKNFLETVFWTSVALHPEPLGSYRGLPSDAICWDYSAPDAIPGVIGGARFSPGTLEADFGGPVAYAKRVVGGWGHDHKRRMRETFGRILSVGSIGENLPNERSFIDLDPDQNDPFGLPKARIHSHLPEMEIKRLKFMRKTCREILEAAGANEYVEEYGTYDMFATSHAFGTCRMGQNPQTSVVDPDCRSHQWRNLLITDASVFPSSGGGEGPSLTIYANALRVADSLVKRGL